MAVWKVKCAGGRSAFETDAFEMCDSLDSFDTETIAKDDSAMDLPMIERKKVNLRENLEGIVGFQMSRSIAYPINTYFRGGSLFGIQGIKYDGPRVRWKQALALWFRLSHANLVEVLNMSGGTSRWRPQFQQNSLVVGNISA